MMILHGFDVAAAADASFDYDCCVIGSYTLMGHHFDISADSATLFDHGFGVTADVVFFLSWV